MSGGSYDYVCFKIKEIELYGVRDDPRRAAFQKLLRLVGEAMHDIEWVDSADSRPGSEHASIDACFAFLQADSATIIKAHAYDALTDMLRKFFAVETKP